MVDQGRQELLQLIREQQDENPLTLGDWAMAVFIIAVVALAAYFGEWL